MEPVGLLVEFEGGQVKITSLGLAAAAWGPGRKLYALVVDAPAEAAEAVLAAHGIDCIVNITTDFAAGVWNPGVWTDAVVAAMQAYGIGTLVGLTSPRGRELLPRIAARLDAPLVMDCLHIDLKAHTARTSLYSGKTIATIALSGRHRIYGLRANALSPVAHPGEAQTVNFRWAGKSAAGLQVLETGSGADGAQDLAEADIIISGGRGMQNGDNFKLLFDCAKPIGAAVGASRAAVDNGWVPYAMQVGQTGAKVNPRVYLACGISGSVQHFAGMKSAKLIIAINRDENAAIVANCDYYAIGDLFEILVELKNQLATRRADPPADAVDPG